SFGAETNSIGKNSGQKERVISDVRADVKARAIVRRLKRRKHFKKIIQRAGLIGKHASPLLRPGKFRQHFGDVISDLSIVNVRAAKNVPHENVEIKPARHLQAAAAFEQRVEQSVVVQNQVAGAFVGKKLDETFGSADLAAQHGEDEFHVLRG